MVTERENRWYKITGPEMSKPEKEYGTSTISNISVDNRHIYYNNVEVEFHNPNPNSNDGINAVIYSVQSLENAFGYTEINDICLHWSTFINSINQWKNSNTIDISESNTDFYQIGNPIAIEESCVIFYDDSSKQNIAESKYDNYVIVLIDKQVVPVVSSITVSYTGDSVPVETEYDESLLDITAHYDNGENVKIETGKQNSPYTIEPTSKVINNLGENFFSLTYINTNNDVLIDNFTVQGCKNLHHIRGYWDGGRIAYGKKAQKKFFVVIACYTDGTETTVTSFEFPNTNIVTEINNGLIDIFYNGKTCQIQVPLFAVSNAKLYAYYNGPDVEIDKDYIIQDDYFTIKVYYSDSEDQEITHSYYENISVENCEFNDTLVSEKGPNVFNVKYNSLLGEIETTFVVNGFKSEVVPNGIQAEYIGPKIYQGETIQLERIHCKIYYSNGTIKEAKNFSLSTNVVKNVGINDITLTYSEDSVILTTPISVEGIENDSTTNNNVFPAELVNKYPKATRSNNRYRGPAESDKTTNYSNMIVNNLNELYDTFKQLEKQYNKLVNNIAGENSTKINTLNNISYMNNKIDLIVNDDHYSTGIYVSEEESE